MSEKNNIRGYIIAPATFNGGKMAVKLDGKYLDPSPSQKIINHSPDGFNWGYGGSGPAQLSLAILLAITTKEKAVRYHQEFKRDVIAKLPQSDFAIDIDIINWLEEREK